MAYMVTCGSDVKIYDVPSYELRHVYIPFKGVTKVNTVTMSEQGHYLAAVPQKGIIELSVINRFEIKKLRSVPNFDFATAVAFQRTVKRYLAVGSARGEVAIFDIKSKNFRKHLTPFKASITHLDFNMKDTHLAAGCDDGQVYLFNVLTNTRTQPAKLNRSASLSSLKFHSTHRTLLGAGDDEGAVVVWDINTKSPKLFVKDAHVAPCMDMAFSPVNDTLVTSVGYDSTFNCYDLGSNKKVISKSMPGPLCSLDIEKSGNIVAIASRVGFIYVLDLRNLNKLVTTIKAHSEEVKKVIYKSEMVDKTAEIEGSTQTSVDITETTPIVKDDSFLDMIGIPKQYDSSYSDHEENREEESEKPTATHDSTNDSFLKAMGLSEPHYDTVPQTTETTEMMQTTDKSIIQKTEETKIESIGDQAVSNNLIHSSKYEEVVECAEESIKTCSEQNYVSESEPEPELKLEGVRYGTNQIPATESVNKAISLQLDQVMENVKNVNSSVEEVLEKVRSEFLQLRMGMVKQFIVQEQKLVNMHQELLKEITNLRFENEELRAQLVKFTNISL